jgi:hypothetical protein
MNKSNTIKIHFSKGRLAGLLIGSSVFSALGIWFVADALTGNVLLGNPIVKVLTGCATVLFFGWVSFYLFKKVFSAHPAVIISNQGIVDNSSGTCAGFIPWKDIKEIKETKVGNRTYFNVVVKDPMVYIERADGSFKRKLMRINYKSYGMAIGISSAGLQCTHKQLRLLLDTRFSEFKMQGSQTNQVSFKNHDL